MRNKIMINSSDKSHKNEDTHLTDDSQVPKKNDIPTRLLTMNRSTSEDENIILTKAERSAQDFIG